MSSTKPESVINVKTPSATGRETLSITDNRTGRQYEVPIKNETIRALDLRPMKVNTEDFGLMGYDPAFTNTASCSSKITFIDGDKGILRYRGYSIEELAEKSTYIETAYLILYGNSPTNPSWRTGPTTSHITLLFTKASRNFSMVFITTPIPWEC